MRIGPQGRLESAAQTGWKAAGAAEPWTGMLLGGCGKAAGLSCCCPDQDADSAHVTGAGRTARNGCPRVAQRYRGRVDGEKWLCHVEWGVEGEGRMTRY